MPSNERILHCRGLHKRFFSRDGRVALHVLRGIDLEVTPGELVTIVGASGAGKSTLLHILGGLDRPTEGTVYWDDKDIFSLNDEQLPLLRAKDVGFVFQFHHLLPEFSALENVAIPAMIAGKSLRQAQDRAREILERVGLSDRMEHKPSELSGGEQQRVAVARALTNRPRIVLADEPSGNLDSENARQLHDLLLGLNQSEGQTLVVVTHNEELSRRSHRILRMADGMLKK